MTSAERHRGAAVRPLRWGWAVLALAAVLAGCAQTERIVLLPDPEGRATSVVVKQGDREVVLDRPYAAAELTRADPWPYRATPAEVEATFGAALAAQPMPATHFTLHFVEGSDELTEESKRSLDGVLAELKRRPVPDILVVGHTDTVGSDQANDALAKKRADTMRALLIERGIPEEDVVAIGRGKRELLVPTADGVAEPRNRRVEILVR